MKNETTVEEEQRMGGYLVQKVRWNGSEPMYRVIGPDCKSVVGGEFAKALLEYLRR